MSVFDEILAANTDYVGQHPGSLPAAPSRHFAILTCMDARLRVFSMTGLQEGDAHVIRNAGGLATDDAIRSLTISQELLGTTAIAVIQHSDCGLLKTSDEQFRRDIEAETGAAPEWSTLAFSDLDASVRRSVATLRELPYLPHRDQIRGFVYEVDTGHLRSVD